MKTIDAKLINKLDMRKLCQYLEKNNWQRLSDLADGMIVQYCLEDTDVIVPLSNQFSDYNYLVDKLLRDMSIAENLSVRALFNKLVNPSCDILRWHISDESTSKGEISFGVMQANIQSIKTMLAATCCDVLTPARFHPKVNTNDVNRHIDTYKFGQTEIGSYILNLICPLGYYQYEIWEPQEENLPLGRRINLKMLSNIAAIQSSVVNHSSWAEDNVAAGNVSVNFLNALLTLYDENRDSIVDLSSLWSNDVPLLTENPISTVELAPRCMEKIGQIAERYTPQQEQNVKKTYYGKISHISGVPNIEDRDKIVISVVAIGDDQQKISIKVELDNAHYSELVTQAFNNGINVKVSGLIIGTGNSKKIIDANLEALDT